MKILKTLCTLALCAAAMSCNSKEATTVRTLPTQTLNQNYPSAPAPLQRQALVKLPAGSIKPQGWLLTQMENQRNGLNGHLGEISAWLQKDGNAWLTAGGSWGWEEVPYWLRGYASLAYAFDDKDMIAEAKVWIDAIINSQREDGNFGPAIARKTQYQDYWPNMLALWILQDWYEYCGDERVIPFMTRYCEYLASVPDEGLFESYWENSRAGDNLWSVIWLYSRTKDERLIPLGEKIHRNTADWMKTTQLPNWHNVNIAQCFREPATWYMFTGNKAHLNYTYGDLALIRRAFGQVPGGMWGGDENSRIGFFDPRQGVETCGMAEMMASDEILTLITGDTFWAENCEDVAFNTYPAAFMPDMRSLRYITSPNMAISDAKNHNPGINNKGPFLAMNPFSSRCCQHNHGFGWPYYSQYLVMASQNGGLAVSLYAPCTASALVAEGTPVTISEETRYPFEESVVFTVGTKSAVSFPLYLRIPSWCPKATVKVNGRKVLSSPEAGTYACISRSWKDGDKVEVSLPMTISTRTWQVNKNSVSVDYGPLTLSLKIAERYVKVDTKKTSIHDSIWQEGADQTKWPSYEIYADSPWNYALATDAAVKVTRRPWPADGNPFTVEGSPLVFKAKGRIVPSWGFDEYGLTGVLPYENAPKSERVDDIELIPMGAARLRISAFPTCSAK